MDMNLEDAVKWLYELRDENERQYVPVARSAETISEMVPYREKIKRKIEAIEIAISFLRQERDKANVQQQVESKASPRVSKRS